MQLPCFQPCSRLSSTSHCTSLVCTFIENSACVPDSLVEADQKLISHNNQLSMSLSMRAASFMPLSSMRYSTNPKKNASGPRKLATTAMTVSTACAAPGSHQGPPTAIPKLVVPSACKFAQGVIVAQVRTIKQHKHMPWSLSARFFTTCRC